MDSNWTHISHFTLKNGGWWEFENLAPLLGIIYICTHTQILDHIHVHACAPYSSPRRNICCVGHEYNAMYICIPASTLLLLLCNISIIISGAAPRVLCVTERQSRNRFAEVLFFYYCPLPSHICQWQFQIVSPLTLILCKTMWKTWSNWMVIRFFTCSLMWNK